MNKHILNEANRLVKWIGCREPFDLAKQLKIDVKFCELGNLKGIYVVAYRNRYIRINENLERDMRRLVCAHEIGHDRFHRELARLYPQSHELISYDMTSKPEWEANMFAAEFLLEDSEVLELVNDEDMNFFRAARELSVPPELLDFKFQILKSKGYRLEAPLYSSGDFLRK